MVHHNMPPSLITQPLLC